MMVWGSDVSTPAVALAKEQASRPGSSAKVRNDEHLESRKTRAVWAKPPRGQLRGDLPVPVRIDNDDIRAGGAQLRDAGGAIDSAHSNPVPARAVKPRPDLSGERHVWFEDEIWGDPGRVN